MKQVRVHGPGHVSVDDVEQPVPTARDVVVDVAACGVCGSDLTYIRQGGVAGPGPEPMPLGHELSGVVAWVGAEVGAVAVGDRVVVHPGDDHAGRIGNGGPEGGLTPSLVVRDAAAGGRVFRVPDGLSLHDAALAEPLAVGMRAVDQAEVTPDDSVAVFGCGPIGLAAIAVLADRGVAAIAAVDPSPTRLELASRLGAHVVIDPSTDDVWARLADAHGTAPFLFGPTPATNAFIEASGVDSVLTDIIDRGREGGRLSVVALHYAPIPTSFLMILMKQFTIRGSMEYPERFEDAIDLLARRDLSAMITHRLPLDDFDRALTLLGDRACGKVLVEIDPSLR